MRQNYLFQNQELWCRMDSSNSVEALGKIAISINFEEKIYHDDKFGQLAWKTLEKIS